MKNFIKLNDVTIDLDTINSTDDLDKITNACVEIMGVVLTIGTSGLPEDEKRVQKILEQSGKIGGAMAKRAFLIIANSTPKPSKEPKEVRHDA